MLLCCCLKAVDYFIQLELSNVGHNLSQDILISCTDV